MRLFSILIALCVAAVLYLVVMQRDVLLSFAGGGTEPEAPVAEAEEAPRTVEEDGTGAGEARVVSVMAIDSVAREVDSAVVTRGRTEAARQVIVRAETSGQVISEPLRKGAFVEAGQMLCEIDPGTRETQVAQAEAQLASARASLPEAQARVAEARAALEEAQINNRAASQLSEGGFASETRVASTRAAVSSAEAALEAAQSGVEGAKSQVQTAEAAVAAAQKEIERLTITAPFSGLLESDSAELGVLLQAGSDCATILQLDPIKLVGFIPETEVGRVETGAQAGARLATGEEVTGQVTFLSRSADSSTRTFRVEVQVPNPDLAIRDGQTVEIAISAEGANAHLLPQSALTLDDDGALGVRWVDEENKARFAPVSVLRDTVDGIWVTGLPEEARVITRGQEYVVEGVPVKVTLEELTQ
ncbi:efflux RND transporter periplasmic adaptor subunit [Vannielia litorea]|uniref:efflux RND transporter periplasmic adaptor subunit n=1 Tax=Vannielia litorea TaxID=1217970 RepID=UPI001BCADDE1|nr:efflux RND transporter periplasmic adaptor subunit [Vannielia litorea]MBS8227869.1 efflux RND transporter periplasmic adaptor subunit [Vannielia litorea]